VVVVAVVVVVEVDVVDVVVVVVAVVVVGPAKPDEPVVAEPCWIEEVGRRIEEIRKKEWDSRPEEVLRKRFREDPPEYCFVGDAWFGLHGDAPVSVYELLLVRVRQHKAVSSSPAICDCSCP